MHNFVKAKMEKHKKVVGPFYVSNSEVTVEALGYTGVDFLIIDTEHGPADVESALRLIRSAELKGITPFVRVKDPTRSSILKMLDIGAQGLIIPCINNYEEINNIVQCGKYYPIGQRGYGMGRKVGWGEDEITKDLGEYFSVCNREQLLIPQCETAGCLADIERIADVEGVDGIFIGPYDLSIALGIPGEFGNPKFEAALKRVLCACKASGKFCFIYSSVAWANKYFDRGFDAVAFTPDINLYIDALKNAVNSIKL